MKERQFDSEATEIECRYCPAEVHSTLSLSGMNNLFFIQSRNHPPPSPVFSRVETLSAVTRFKTVFSLSLLAWFAFFRFLFFGHYIR